MIFDDTGRKLKVGQVVKIPTQGMMVGQVVEIHESALVLPGQQGQVPPRVIVALAPIEQFVQVNRAGNLVVPDMFIVAEGRLPEQPDSKNGKDEGESGGDKKPGISLVH